MDVNPGYKRTEVGVVPEAWAIHVCSELSERIMVGIVIRPAQYYVRHGVPALRSANIREDGINDLDLVYISNASNVLLAKSQTRTGDVLTVRTGYPGTSAVVRPVHAGSNCIDILITRPSSRVDSDWLAIWINSSFGKEQVLRNQGGLAQKHFNVGDMRNLVVALPPLPEQRAIAAALRDVDALLAGLDRLIAKKRDLKQAAMQQLLTGQTRLVTERVVKSGFKQTEFGLIPEDWEVLLFKELFEISAGGDVNTNLSSSAHDENHCYPIYSNALSDKGLYGFCSYADHPAGSITITARGTLGFASYRDHKYTAIGRVLVLCPRRDGAGPFFAEFINSRVKFAIESTGVPQLTAPQIGEYRLAVPPPAEQIAIAAVLSDMDTELTALVARRDKTRDLKQAMMQELLTGKTRLIPAKAKHA